MHTDFLFVKLHVINPQISRGAKIFQGGANAPPPLPPLKETLHVLVSVWTQLLSSLVITCESSLFVVTCVIDSLTYSSVSFTCDLYYTDQTISC